MHGLGPARPFAIPALDDGSLAHERWQSFQKLQREQTYAACKADAGLGRETKAHCFAAATLTQPDARVFDIRMFTIIGGDGKEYGPVSTEQLRTWMNAGRANLDTKAKAAGAEEWRRLGDFAEFSSPAAPPPVMSTPPSTFTPVVPPSEAGPELASLGQRLGGAMIDGVLKGLCWMPTALAIWAVLGDQIRAGQQPSPTELLDAMSGVIWRSVPFLIVLAIAQAVLLTTRGQSIGKILASTRVVRHVDQAKAGFLHAFLLRGGVPWVLEQIPLLGGLFWIIDVGFIFSDERRCVHDYIASTKVVKA